MVRFKGSNRKVCKMMTSHFRTLFELDLSSRLFSPACLALWPNVFVIQTRGREDFEREKGLATRPHTLVSLGNTPSTNSAASSRPMPLSTSANFFMGTLRLRCVSHQLSNIAVGDSFLHPSHLMCLLSKPSRSANKRQSAGCSGSNSNISSIRVSCGRKPNDVRDSLPDEYPDEAKEKCLTLMGDINGLARKAAAAPASSTSSCSEGNLGLTAEPAKTGDEVAHAFSRLVLLAVRLGR